MWYNVLLCFIASLTKRLKSYWKYIIGNKIWLGTIKNKPLSQSLQKQTQGKDISFNKTL